MKAQQNKRVCLAGLVPIYSPNERLGLEFPKSEIDMYSPTSSSFKLPYPKTQKLDGEEEEDGWHDRLDDLYDRAAEKGKIDHPDFEKLTQRERDYYLSIYRTRGYDPDEEYMKEEDEDRLLYNLDVKSMKLMAGEWAEAAIFYYNHLKAKNLQFVEVKKIVSCLTDMIDRNYFFLTFEAEEEGKPSTRKHYQTRVLVGAELGLHRVCSFRPKPT